MRYSNEDVDTDELKRCIREGKRLKRRISELKIERLNSSAIDNFNVRDYKGKKVVTALHGWSWDYYVGIGDTEDEALHDMKPRINTYDPKFDDYEYNFPPSYLKTR